MKAVFAIGFIFLLPLLLQGQDAQQKVRLYTNDNYTGSHGDFGIGKYSYNQLASSGAYVVYSLKIPKGLRVTLYPQDNFSGKSLALTEDTTQPILLKNGFANGAVIVSMIVDLAPEKPLPVATTQTKVPVVTLYKDNFDGDYYELPAGQYEFTEMGIGNDQLSSIKIPKGMKVTLYDNEGFEGKSLVLIKDTGASFFVSSGFNDLTSSLIVEVIPDVPAVTTVTPVVTTTTVAPVVVPAVVVVTTNPIREVKEPDYTGPVAIIYSENFKGQSRVLKPGRYNYDEDFGMPATAPFSLKIQQGLIVTLFDEKVELVGNTILAKGRKLVLMKDTDSNVIKSAGFAGDTWWVLVEEAKPVEPDPVVTIYRDDFSGSSKTLTPGRYGYQDLGIGDNTLSSISIPRGLKVTLYESPAFEGRTAILRADAGADFFVEKYFNDITSSILVETVPASDLEVIVFRDDFSGASKAFSTGKYNAQDLGIGDNQLSSVIVPAGMKVTLYENDNMTGRSLTLTRNTNANFIISSKFNDLASSLTVEDAFVPYVAPVVVEPVVTPVVAPVVVAPVVVTTVTPAVVIPEVPLVEVPPCQLTDKQYSAAMNAMQSKHFRDELIATARLATKDKCLTIEQIRSFAKFFSFSDQKLEFVKYAYDLSSEKSDYYTLDDVFVFMTDKQEFTKFLSSK